MVIASHRATSSCSGRVTTSAVQQGLLAPYRVPMYIRTIIALISVVLITSCGTTALSRNEITEFVAGKKAIVRTYNQPILAGMILGHGPPCGQSVMEMKVVMLPMAMFV